MTIEEIKEIVNKYFGDTSRSQDDTRAGLQELMEEIEILLDSLE